jgi:hypothetical protein
LAIVSVAFSKPHRAMAAILKDPQRAFARALEYGIFSGSHCRGRRT